MSDIFADMADIFASTFSRDEAITVQPAGGTARNVSGRAIFRRAGLPVAAGDLDLISSGPELHLTNCDAEGLDAEDAVTVDDLAFQITQRLPDGRGMVRFLLREMP